MSYENIKKSGKVIGTGDDRGGAILIPHPVVGIVKDNIDKTRTGKLRVYIARFGGSDPDDSRYWVTVKYMSPFYGIISPGYNYNYGEDSDSEGKYVGNPHSYGFWATAPDIGTTVLCVFVDGKPNDGYYIGSIPITGLNHMIPAIGATNQAKANKQEEQLYGGAERLPVVEVNYGNIDYRNSPNIFNIKKPVHSYQASILAKQGLIRDNIRGVIGSSAMRESPSKVFGISTPGQAIYTGKYDKTNVENSASTDDSTKFQIEGRTGGHTLVMDDGTLNGQDQLIRLRTSAGHTILMSDSGQVLTIIHANGQSWVELNKEGAIDVFATNSVNIRSQGDINLHADRDINFHAKRNYNLFADNIKTEAAQNHHVRTGKDYSAYHMGKFTVKVDQQMSLLSQADSSFKSNATTFINGKRINLNTGSSSTVPQTVQEIPKISHVETIFSESSCWINPGKEPLKSIVTRAPTHMPWENENKGVAL